MKILDPQLLQTSCLQTLARKNNYFYFFIKQGSDNSSFDLVTYNNSIITVCFFLIYKSVATNLTMVVFFEVGLSGIW